MPYINNKNNRREALRNEEPALNAGELNYQIFYHVKHADFTNSINVILLDKRVKTFVKQFLGGKPNYQKYNDISGVAIRCFKEIQRRLGINYAILYDILLSYDKEIENYEDEKIKQNNDVE